MRAILAAISVILSIYANSADWKNLEGIYAVTAKNMVSSVEDSHYKIQLKGQSAKDLYDSIKVLPQKDDCTGALAKNIGEMQCLYYRGNDKYECHFSINIAEQKIEYGVSC